MKSSGSAWCCEALASASQKAGVKRHRNRRMVPVDQSVWGSGRYGPASACSSKIRTMSAAIDEPSMKAVVASGNAEGSACRNVVLSTAPSWSSQHGPTGRESGICIGRNPGNVTSGHVRTAIVRKPGRMKYHRWCVRLWRKSSPLCFSKRKQLLGVPVKNFLFRLVRD